MLLYIILPTICIKWTFITKYAVKYNMLMLKYAKICKINVLFLEIRSCEAKNSYISFVVMANIKTFNPLYNRTLLDWTRIHVIFTIFSSFFMNYVCENMKRTIWTYGNLILRFEIRFTWFSNVLRATFWLEY